MKRYRLLAVILARVEKRLEKGKEQLEQALKRTRVILAEINKSLQAAGQTEARPERKKQQ